MCGRNGRQKIKIRVCRLLYVDLRKRFKFVSLSYHQSGCKLKKLFASGCHSSQPPKRELLPHGLPPPLSWASQCSTG